MSDRRLADIGWLALTPLAAALRRAAGPVATHWVGGTVRDALLGISPADFDAVVERDGEGIALETARLTGCRPVRLGKHEFATYRLVGATLPGATSVDLWDRRGTPLAVDLLRRDFTLNAVAVDLTDGRILDPLGGRDDLAAGRLRQVSSTGFASDPVRVLRLVRFAGRFGFAVEPRTLSSAKRAKARLGDAAAERVREEWKQILLLPRLAGCLSLLQALGLLGSGADADAALARLGRLEDHGVEFGGGAGRWALLDAGAPPQRASLALARWCAIARSLGPAAFGQLFAEPKWIERDLARRVARLAAAAPPGSADADRRQWLHEIGEDWQSLARALAAELFGDREEAWRWLADLQAEDARLRSALGQGLLIDGEDLLRCGLAPGRRLGSILAEVRRLQVRGELRDRRQALERARQLIARVTSATPGAD